MQPAGTASAVRSNVRSEPQPFAARAGSDPPRTPAGSGGGWPRPARRARDVRVPDREPAGRCGRCRSPACAAGSHGAGSDVGGALRGPVIGQLLDTCEPDHTGLAPRVANDCDSSDRERELRWRSSHKPGNLARRGWSGTTLRAVATSATVLLAVAACGSKPSESASSGDSKDPIVVGISLPLTGDFSQPGGEAATRLRDLARPGQRRRRPARPAGRAQDHRRRQQPGHRRLRLHEADHAGQGRPAARHLLLAAQLPGLRGRREERDGLRRAGRRRAEHVRPRLQVPVLRPAGDRAAPGRRLRRLHQVACRPTSGRRPRRTRPRTTRSPRR